MHDPTTISAICFGEILFDMIPSGKKPGGAPMNVAVHLQHLGVPSSIISSIGNDELGKELIAFLKSKGVNTHLIQQTASKETGTVEVNLEQINDPSYTIVEDVAWDHIDESFLESITDVDFIIHGSLACRSHQSRKSLNKLIKQCNAKIVFDLNLRSPFYSKPLIEDLIRSADYIKVNDDEFELLKSWYHINMKPKKMAINALHSIHSTIKGIIITQGAKGANAWFEGQFINVRGYAVKVVDTIGSGDAFLAAFISKYAQGKSIEYALDFASATGAFVATKAGANPDYNESDITTLINNTKK